MPRYAIELALSGTHYAGTAIQPEPTPTLHRHLMQCFEQLESGSGDSLQCCSRLDSGVAAQQFTAHIDLNGSWQPADLIKALNGILRWPDNQRHAVVFARPALMMNGTPGAAPSQQNVHYHVLVSAVPPLHQRALPLATPPTGL